MFFLFRQTCVKTMSYKKIKQNSLPPRWLHCPRKGEPILNIFLPFKTPLDDKFEVEDQYK